MAKHGNRRGGGRPPALANVRTIEVVRLLMTGATRSDVLAYARENWGIAPRSADRLIAAARAEIRGEWLEVERPQLLAELLSRISMIEQEARRTGNLALALAAINSTARLAGLF